MLSWESAPAEFSVYEFGPVELKPGAQPTPSDRLDELVFKRLGELGLKPANLCSDVVFLRRAYLCVIGKIPTESEARAYLESSKSDRRAKLIDSLLERLEYSDYLAMRWADVLRVKAEFPSNLWPNAVQAYYRWIWTSVRGNKPYDQFVREMLTTNGSNFRDGPVNFYRAMQDRSPKGIASTVAFTFMGERTEHWPPRKVEAMSGFFAQVAYKKSKEWKEEMVYFDPTADKDGLAKKAIFPDGRPGNIRVGVDDPRFVFADWMTSPANAAFTRCICNRLWYWMMGRGIVHEPDDFRADNPPSNPALLEFLQREFLASKMDMKNLIRIILNSKTFQLSSIPVEDKPEAAVNFAYYPLRHADAEVQIDAINQITGTHESYSSPIPEPFTFIPDNMRAVQLADASVTSSFLELFGRSPRDKGIDSERNRTVRPNQRLHLLNSSHVLKKIKDCPLVKEAAGGDISTQDLTEKIYLITLSRMPTDEEAKIAKQHASRTSPGEFAGDLIWALINLPEFDHIH